MSKLKSKLARRIMAIVLSGAMVMSNMSAYAAELTTEPETEVVSEVEETAAADEQDVTVSESSEENSNDENAETEAPVEESSESVATEATTKDEDVEEATTTNVETETVTEDMTESVEDTETEEEEAESEKASIEDKDNKDDAVAEGTYILNPDTVLGTLTSETTISSDTQVSPENYFTILKNVKADGTSKQTLKIDGQDQEIVNRIKYGNPTKINERGIKFTISDGKKASILLGANSSSTSKGGGYAKLCKIVDGSMVDVEGTKHQFAAVGTVTWEDIEAGTYIIAGYKPVETDSEYKEDSGKAPQNLNIYYVRVVETTAGGEVTPSERGNWSDVDDPQIMDTVYDVSQKDTKISVKVKGVINKTGVGADKLTVKMFDTNTINDDTTPIDTVTFSSNTTADDEGNHYSTAEFTPKASGNYYFQAVLERSVDTDTDYTPKKATTSTAVEFSLPLNKPVISKADFEIADGKGIITLEWNKVTEADYYIVRSVYADDANASTTIADVKVEASETPTATIADLAVGSKVKVSVQAFRGTAEEPAEIDQSEESAQRTVEIEGEVVLPEGTKIFESKKLTSLSATASLEEIPLDADGYFVMVARKGKPKLAEVDPEFEFNDGYTTAKLAQFGGAWQNTGGDQGNWIQFTTESSVEVKVWWQSTNTARTVALFDTDMKELSTGDAGTTDPSFSVFSIEEKGTYRIASSAKVGSKGDIRIAKIQVTEVAPARSESIDISDGLKQGTVYGSTDFVTLEVLEDMNASSIADGKEIEGVKYFASIQGSNNAKPNAGAIPTSGAVFKITAYMDANVTFVTGAAAGKKWHVVRESDQKQIAGGNEIPEGKIKFRVQPGQTYYFYADGSKVKAYAITMEEYKVIIRDDWTTIAPPVIKTHELKKDGEVNTIELTVEGAIGETTGDEIAVEMYNVNDPDTVVTTVATGVKGSSRTVTFKPSESGSYFFKAFLSRNAEESPDDPDEEIVFDDKESPRYPAEDGVEFAYALQPPLISAVTNLGAGEDGKGTIEVDWVKASEATGYEVLVKDASGNPAGTELKTNQILDAEGNVTKEAETIGNVSGLTVGETYQVQVCAVRTVGETTDKSSYSDATEITITSDKKLKWSFSASGSSTSLSKTSKKLAGYQDPDGNPKNGYHKDSTADNDFDVEVWSVDGAGKVVPATTDGLAFYYTELNPNDTNFTLTATAHVEQWTYSNGQDGFGLMVSDTVGEHGNGDYVWTNCYQNVVSKIEFRWDGEKPGDYSDVSLPRYSMKLGVGATEKIGATAKDIDDIWAGAISQPKIWSSTQYAIDYSMTHLPAGTYNVVGNATNQNAIEGNIDRNGKILNNQTDSFDNMQVDFDLILQKNNNGYKLSYTNKDTGVTAEKQFYGTDVLNQIESDKIYVGVFAGRNADVTFKNVHLETYSPGADEPAQEQETTYINLMTSISSASTSNTSDYDLVFSSNWDGKLEIRNSDNVVVGKADVTGSLDTVLDQLEDGDDNKDTKAHVEISGLNIGSNVLTATFTPSKDMKNPPEYTALTSYDPVTIVHTVDYRKYGNNNSILYVAQNGKSSGTGTKADPLDIFTAIKYVQPGQKIFLAGGRYALNKTISIARGINGEEGKMIYMMADPEAEERPVFDFQKRVTGMTLGGDYWYFKGFDVTGSLDGQKGIQLSGSHNVLDQINTYKNGNTGIQVSGSGNDTYKYWPSYNYILNCTSYLNSDAGYEDADGFAAKLTIGSGNVFDGCIAAYNADDGWDLFAKIESGQIGSVTIRNSIAYKNGYVLVDAKTKELSLSGEETDAGNGNGFKMGGDGLPGGSIYDLDDNGKPYYDTYGKFKGHVLENSLAFENKSKGFDSNSCPNNKVYNSISFNNEGGNVELYTYNNVQETDYKVENVLSFRTKYTSVIDKISPKGGQITDKSAFINEKTYLWNQRPNASINKNGIRVNKSWFKSVTFEGTKASSYKLFGRNADGSIDRNGFMEIDIEKMTADIEAQGHTMEESGLDAGNLGLKPTVSPTDEELKGDSEETPGDISAGAGSITDDDNSGELYEEEQENAEKHGIVVVQDADVSYTGTAVKPEIRVYLNGKRFSDYSISYRNNINAYVEGNANYSDIPDEKRPQMILKLKGAYREDYIYYFDILPVDIGNKALVAAPDIAVDKAQAPKVVLTHNGKKLSLGKDFNVYTEEVKTNEDGTTETTYNPLGKTPLSENTTLKAEGIGNYAGETKISFIMVDTSKLKLMSKAKIKLAASTYTYTGSEIVPDITLDGAPLALAKVIEKDKDENGNEIDVETDVYAKDADGNYYDKSGLYTVRIANGTEVGKATVTVTAKTIVPPTVEEGAEAPATPTAVYAGSTTAAFTINKAPIKIDNIVFVSQKNKEETVGKNIVLAEQTYTGSARVQQGTFKVVIDGTEFSGIAAGSRDINKVDSNTNLYLYNYTYQYKNNIEAGNASVIIKGIHNCTGSVTLKFKINPASAETVKQYRKPYTEKGADGNVTEIRPEKLTGTELEVVYDYDVTYVSSGAKPTVSVYYKGNGVSKKNFTVAYKNNKNAGDEAQAIITWKGGLKGTAPTTLEYRISKCKLEDNVYVKSISDVFTNGKTSVPASELDKSKAVIMNAKTRLSANRDYTLEYEYDEYDSDLKAVPAKNAEGAEIEGVINRKIYDSTDKNAKKNPIYVPKTGLDIAVYIKPVSGGRVDNYETSADGGRVKVADIRIAYFDIAKANIKLIDPATGKTPILYYNDKTELANMSNSLSDATLNQLDSKYIQIYHAAYAKEYGNGAKDYYVKLTDFGKKKDDGYTYDKTATGAVSAGTQKVTFYGTGLFGGSKVFKYKLEKKTYNISKAIVDTKTGIYLASDEYLALTDNSKISKELQASLEAQLTKAFEGKITNVNGIDAVLASDRYICTYDIKDLANCKSGKAITVIIKGTNSYSGTKKVKIMAKMVSSNLGKASVSAATVEAPKDDIADGVVFGNDDSALNKAIAGKIKVDDYTLTYGVDYTENDAEYIVFAKDEEGNYIVDADGETMMDENGEVVKDENGNPIKYKVVRKYTGYYNNKAASTEETPAYVCIKGIGGFEGVLEVAVTIKEAEEKTAEQKFAKN